MKKKFLTGILIIACTSVYAQIPEDVLKYSWQRPNGTARSNAVGGAMGSLGGDISATFSNPAGLAFYRTSDLVFSPGYSFLNNKSEYRGTNNAQKNSNFNLGASGFVGGLNGSGRWANKAVSFAVTRTASFSNKIYYSGQNDFSSFAEQYASEAAASGQSIDQMLGNNSNVSLGTQMALHTFLVDTVTLGSATNPDFVSTAMFSNLRDGAPYLVNQSHNIETSGGVTELAIGYAANRDDKFYLGGSIGIPIVNYERVTTLREEDARGDDPYFNFADLREVNTTKGFGVNLKLGMILRASEALRLGLAVHSPSIYALTDSYYGELRVDNEAIRDTRGVYSRNTSEILGQTPQYDYDLNTPWKFLLSGAYVLGTVEDVRAQKGFLTAEVEYVTHRSNRFRSADGGDQDYYQGLNETTKSYYSNALNFRLGGEMKFNTIMGRLGLAYYGNPYADKELSASKMFISGGLGYRHAGMYIDLTYIHGLEKDVNFPYRLSDKANTFSTIKTSGSNLMLTLGIKI